MYRYILPFVLVTTLLLSSAGAEQTAPVEPAVEVATVAAQPAEAAAPSGEAAAEAAAEPTPAPETETK